MKRNGIFRKGAAVAAVALSVSLLFCGCAGNTGASNSNSSGKEGMYFEEPKESTAEEKADSSSSSGKTPGKSNTDALQELKIIKTANITLEANNAFSVFSELTEKAASLGGYVQESSVFEERGSITLRIPVKSAEGFISSVREGYKVKNFSEDSEDVTDKYTDNEARLQSARAALKRYQELLSKAATIDEILRIQDRIDQATADLEAYEALKSSYDSRVAYETIVITINNPVVKSDNRWEGLSESLSDGMFVGFAVFLHVLIIILYCLPFLIVLLIIIALVRRHNRKKMKDRPIPPPMGYPGQRPVGPPPAPIAGPAPVGPVSPAPAPAPAGSADASTPAASQSNKNEDKDGSGTST